MRTATCKQAFVLCFKEKTRTIDKYPVVVHCLVGFYRPLHLYALADCFLPNLQISTWKVKIFANLGWSESIHSVNVAGPFPARDRESHLLLLATNIYETPRDTPYFCFTLVTLVSEHLPRTCWDVCGSHDPPARYDPNCYLIATQHHQFLFASTWY